MDHSVLFAEGQSLEEQPQKRSCCRIHSRKREICLLDVFWGVLLYFVCPFVAAFLVYFIVALTKNHLEIERVTQGEMTPLLLLTTFVGVAFAFVGWPWLLSLKKGSKSLTLDFGLDVKLGDLFWGTIGGLCSLGSAFIAGFFWYMITGSREMPSNIDFLGSFDSTFLNRLCVFLLIAVWTPVAEELFFRGFALRVFCKKFGTLVAVVSTSLLFGILHVPFYAAGSVCWLLFSITTVYGVIFALLTVARDFRIGAAIFAHCFLNSAVILFHFYRGF